VKTAFPIRILPKNPRATFQNEAKRAEAGHKKILDGLNQASQDSGVRWNFNDTSEWSDLSSETISEKAITSKT